MVMVYILIIDNLTIPKINRLSRSNRVKHTVWSLTTVEPKHTFGGRGCNAKKKTSPKFRICCSLRVFSVFCGSFSVFFGRTFDKKFQPFKNDVNNEVSRGQELPNNTPNACRALQMSHKSYYNQQEPLNKNPLNQPESAKMEKPKKTKKKKRK